MVIHLSGQPGDIGRAARPLLGLAPGGVYLAATITRDAGALLPHRFTLTGPEGPAVYFLLHVLQVTPHWLSPAPCPMEPRPSSTRSPRRTPCRDHPANSSSQSASHTLIQAQRAIGVSRPAFPVSRPRGELAHT